jgi:hypothetical protein
MFQASNLTSAIYNIDWYNTEDLKIKRFILFWLQRTQMEVQMSGAGIIKISRPVLLQVRLLEEIMIHKNNLSNLRCVRCSFYLTF